MKIAGPTIGGTLENWRNGQATLYRQLMRQAFRTSAPQVDVIAHALTDAAAKLADLLKRQAVLKAELDAAANEADAATLSDFADVFRTMAAKLGSLAGQDGRPAVTPARRRGRPPKPPDDEPTVT